MLHSTLIAALLFANPDVPSGGASGSDGRALFDEGRRLVQAGQTALACPKFEESNVVEPKAGTLENLADCYEKTGRLGSAWRAYKRAESMLENKGPKARLDSLRRHVSDLEARVPRLRIVPAPNDIKTTITRDNAVVDATEYSASIPVDAGEHIVFARAPGAPSWSATVRLVDGVVVTVEVPALVPAKTESNVPSSAPSITLGEGLRTESSFWSTPRVVGVAAGAVGVAVLGISAGFAISAQQKWSTVKTECGPSLECSSASSLDSADQARSQANLATYFAIGGGVMLAGGAALVLLNPGVRSRTSPAATLAPTVSLTSFGVRGFW